jgi:hypothetical protein
MDCSDTKSENASAPVSEQILRGIVEQGFFGAPGSLADARAACAELIFARTVIEAQTARIAQLHCNNDQVADSRRPLRVA